MEKQQWKNENISTIFSYKKSRERAKENFSIDDVTYTVRELKKFFFLISKKLYVNYNLDCNRFRSNVASVSWECLEWNTSNLYFCYIVSSISSKKLWKLMKIIKNFRLKKFYSTGKFKKCEILMEKVQNSELFWMQMKYN